MESKHDASGLSRPGSSSSMVSDFCCQTSCLGFSETYECIRCPRDPNNTKKEENNLRRQVPDKESVLC